MSTAETASAMLYWKATHALEWWVSSPSRLIRTFSILLRLAVKKASPFLTSKAPLLSEKKTMSSLLLPKSVSSECSHPPSHSLSGSLLFCSCLIQSYSTPSYPILTSESFASLVILDKRGRRHGMPPWLWLESWSKRHVFWQHLYWRCRSLSRPCTHKNNSQTQEYP